MPYFLGIDGGGSKTDCLLVNESGQILSVSDGIGTSYRQYGKDEVIKTLRQLSERCLSKAGVLPVQVSGVCVGLPAYGENASADSDIIFAVEAFLSKVIFVNDVQVGWAGSLACQAGINVVAGTGSIAFGCDGEGNTARSGGWTEVFSDEGSAYWVAVRGMQLFTKQADGRAAKGELYRIIRDAYCIQDDFKFVSVAESELLPRRDKTAAFQKLIADAAKAGDLSVLAIYTEAAKELASLAVSVKKRLNFDSGKVAVSYSGGMFQVGEMLLNPFRHILQTEGMCAQKPLLSPVKGAVLLAVKHFAPNHFKNVTSGLTE